MSFFPLIWRTGQVLAAVCGLIGLIGLSLPLIFQGFGIAVGMEWAWRRKKHWLGFPEDEG